VKTVLVISTCDNVATALEPLQAGQTLELEERRIRLCDAVPPGHKVAITPIPCGAQVIKYGSAIGTAISDIAAGAHVHTHNVASARGRGDLAVTAAAVSWSNE
jgi:altronate dehydratase